ncbi:erythroblast NAD(P)(+)--arginine ADP-ribosyltransferase-like isoform X2 [Sebastes umbrosus]|uniref:erythroblast NAD(P)(+)--arginine ADP-ribosyltransferase-like isoform X2 n=1 Tax=Sebastes umbrosus TaxID=72105 RepID=UPI00189DD997|nr:erythroblast NAD(P)(+)--arginine ADP-ribosyltransferase-like isoform X2 [Sebastes umbrosus]
MCNVRVVFAALFAPLLDAACRLQEDSTVFLTAVMKGNMLIFAPFCLLLCCMLPADAVPIHLPLRDTNKDIPLSMEEDSVDDRYFDCDAAKMEIIKNKSIEEEMNKRPFSGAWKNATVCANEKFEQREDKALTKDHMLAICIYTGEDVYMVFNEAVRTNRSIYGSSFQFHSLHYLLTSAIQILNNNNNCYDTYRRVRTSFTGKVNQIIRFGSFTSSSKKTDLIDFGNETCFKIRTCSGAYLKNYPTYGDEEEVLIPPYEKFTITEISDDPGKFKGLEDCKKVIVLETAGVESRLNCKFAPSAIRGTTIMIIIISIIITIIIISIIIIMIKRKHKCTTISNYI